MTTASSSATPVPRPARSHRGAGAARRHGLAALTLGAIGVVYGDIGTSPLYTMREVFAPATGVRAERGQPDRRRVGDLLGADAGRHVQVRDPDPARRQPRRRRRAGADRARRAARSTGRPRLRHALLLLGVFGATLFYGDGVITPAISVLGAMEGLEVVAPALEPYVVPALGGGAARRCSCSSASAPPRVGKLFGPVICCGSSRSRVTGVVHIVQQPAILAALNPLHAYALPRRARLADVRRRRCDRAGDHRRRGAVRRHGALRPRADPPRLGRPRAAGARAQLHGPGRAADGATRRRIENPFYRLFPAGCAGAGDRAGHAGGDHRLAGGDLGRLLDDQAGDPARLPAAHGAALHLGARGRPDLHAGGELGACWPAWSASCSLSAARRRWPAPTASR